MEPEEPEFTLGDVNGDGVVSIVDVTALIDVLLGDGTYIQAGDMDEDGSMTIVDVTALIDVLLSMD